MRHFCSAVFLLFATTAPSVADEASPHRTINVRDQGAVCNGIKDDTQAFRKAIDKAPVGGMVSVPPGRCVISDTLLIDPFHAVSIVGAGRASQIYQKSQTSLFEFQGVNALVIKDLYLGSASTAPGTALIKLTNSHHMRIDNVTMLGSYYGLHLKGSLLNTMVDLRSGTNFQGFFGATSITEVWVFGERFNGTSANANTFIAPVLEGGANGISLVDVGSEGSLNITGGSIEGVSGTALRLAGTFLPSAITGTHFEVNGTDVALQSSSNVRFSAIFSTKPINLTGDTRNVMISDSIADHISIQYTPGPIQPTPSGAKRIILQNITTCVSGVYSISPPPIGFTPGPSQSPDPSRPDIIYTNIGVYCGGL